MLNDETGGAPGGTGPDDATGDATAGRPPAAGDLTGGEPLDERSAALVACLMDIERHVGGQGWDQPVRLYALAATAQLAADEPALAEQLGLSTDADPLSLTPVEQDGFDAGSDLARALVTLAWPPTVLGVAVVSEQTMLPPDAEAELSDDPVEAAQQAADHAERTEVRLVVGVHRDGSRHGLARFRSHPDELVGSPDLVPRLAELLAAGLEPDTGEAADVDRPA